VNTVGACFHATTPFPRLLKWFGVDNEARNKIQISILNPCFSTRDMFHPRPRDMTFCEPRHILTTPILLPTSTSKTSHDTLRLKPPSRRKQISRCVPMRLECWHTAKSDHGVARFTKIHAICRSRFRTGLMGISWPILAVRLSPLLRGTGRQACKRALR
jgi:hypothetical protein